MPITVSADYEVVIPEGSGGGVLTITGISVPSLATAAILIIEAGTSNNSSVDISNFDGDTDNHFTNIVTANGFAGETSLACTLLYGETGFPARGATGLTLTFSLNKDLEWGDGSALLVFLSGTDTTRATHVVGTDTSTEGFESNWVSNNLGTQAGDIAFIGGINYQADYDADDPGQTVILDVDTGSADYYRSIGYEIGEATPGMNGTAEYFCGAAFAIKAAAGGTILPQMMHQH